MATLRSRSPLSQFAGCGIPLALLGLIAVTPVARSAEPVASPWSAEASVAGSFDSNATRTNGTAAQGDQLLAETLHARYTLPVSLQKFVFNAQLGNVHYRRHAFLDYQGNDVSAAWFGDLAGRLAPVVTVSDRRTLSPLSNFQVAVRDVVRDQEVRLMLDKTLDARLQVGMGASRDWQTNSDPGNAYNDNTLSRVDLHTRYLSGQGDVFSLTAQESQARFRFAQPALPGGTPDNTWRERQFDLGVQAMLIDAMALDARAGYYQRTYEAASTRNSQGPAGRLGLRRDGPVLELGARYERTLGGVLYLASSALVVDRFTADGRWKFSPRTSLSASWSHARENYQGDFGTARRQDIHISRNLNLDYAATPALAISLGIAGETRSSSFSVNDFDDQLIQLAVSVHL